MPFVSLDPPLSRPYHCSIDATSTAHYNPSSVPPTMHYASMPQNRQNTPDSPRYHSSHAMPSDNYHSPYAPHLQPLATLAMDIASAKHLQSHLRSSEELAPLVHATTRYSIIVRDVHSPTKIMSSQAALPATSRVYSHTFHSSSRVAKSTSLYIHHQNSSTTTYAGSRYSPSHRSYPAWSPHPFCDTNHPSQNKHPQAPSP